MASAWNAGSSASSQAASTAEVKRYAPGLSLINNWVTTSQLSPSPAVSLEASASENVENASWPDEDAAARAVAGGGRDGRPEPTRGGGSGGVLPALGVRACEQASTCRSAKIKRVLEPIGGHPQDPRGSHGSGERRDRAG